MLFHVLQCDSVLDLQGGTELSSVVTVVASLHTQHVFVFHKADSQS